MNLSTNQELSSIDALYEAQASLVCNSVSAELQRAEAEVKSLAKGAISPPRRAP